MGNLQDFLAEIEEAKGDCEKLMELAGTIRDQDDYLRQQMEEAIVAALMDTDINLFTLAAAVGAFSGKTGKYLLLQKFVKANPLATPLETIIIFAMIQGDDQRGAIEVIEAILVASTWLTPQGDLSKVMTKGSITVEAAAILTELGLLDEGFFTQLMIEMADESEKQEQEQEQEQDTDVFKVIHQRLLELSKTDPVRAVVLRERITSKQKPSPEMEIVITGNKSPSWQN